jgi:hypothetical protein
MYLEASQIMGETKAGEVLETSQSQPCMAQCTKFLPAQLEVDRLDDIWTDRYRTQFCQKVEEKKVIDT